MFEDIKANIELLEKMDHIPVEVLLNSMFRLYQGAKTAKMIADMPVADPEKYAKNLSNLFECIRPSYLQVRDQLKQMDSDYLQIVLESCEKTDAQLERLRPIIKQLEDARAENTRLAREYQELEEKRAELQKLADRVNGRSAREIEQMREESENMLVALRNAWGSLRTREDLPLALDPLEEFCGVRSDIQTFSDLEQWFDEMDSGIEKALTAYAEMYRKLLEILGETAQ